MDLSLILCTWNNAARLRITLDAIAQCEVPEGLRWELVLVNNNCTDNTDAVAAEFADRFPLNYVHESTPGLSHARNAGLTAASGEVIVFTDDDVRPYPRWLATFWEAYERYPKEHYFGGPLESEFEGTPPPQALLDLSPWSVKGLEWGAEERIVSEREKFVSANWACAGAMLRQLGGFDTGLGLVGGDTKVAVGEESDLMRRLQDVGWTPVYLPEARLRHFVPTSKISVRHIAERQRAYGYYRSTVLHAHVDQRGPRIAGVPIALIDSGFRSWFYWMRVRMRRQNADLPYVHWKRAWGEILGALDTWWRRGRTDPTLQTTKEV